VKPERDDRRLLELAAIVESSYDAIVGKRLDGTITSWNPAAERMFGYASEEMIGRSIELLEPEERRGEIAGVLDRLAAGERIRDLETVRVAKDGTHVDILLTISPIVIGGAIVGASAISHDLTTRKAAEALVRQSEETYRRLFELHPEPMHVYDLESLRILAVNAAMVESYGWTREEFLDMSLDDIWRPEDREGMRRAIAETVPGASVPAHESRHVRKDGSVIVVAVSACATSFDGRAARLVQSQDITERRRLEEELRQSQKMDAIGRLAGGIAHDFNNLLVVIRGNSHLLLKQVEGKSRDYVEQIDAAADRASQFTRELLTFSRLQVLQLEPVDVNGAVTGTLTLLRRALGEDVKIELDLDPQAGAVLVDRSELAKAILNLAINARDAMPQGGTLAFRTAAVELGEGAGGGDLPAGRYVLLQTTDSGVGMDEDTQARAFDPFFTTKDDGTGLGLSSVYGLVKQSGGHIWLYSEPGLGTTFKLYLPVTEAEPAPAARPAAVESLDGSELILVVEDADMVRDLVTATLESYGYEVIAVANAEDALDVAHGLDRKIDLLLTDVVMPGLNGRELADRLRAERPGLNVLFTSGYPADTVLRLGIADASAAFIEKPYLPDQLAATIRAILDRASSP
jgi:PAS domain S-box-containing protein